MIDQHVARHFVLYSECLSNPFPLYATQIILKKIIQGSQPIPMIYIKDRNFIQSWIPYALNVPLV